jgi:hypothetical protein
VSSVVVSTVVVSCTRQSDSAHGSVPEPHRLARK